MSIPYSNIINVSIGVSPTAVALPGFGNLLFLTDEADNKTGVDATNRVQSFSSLTEVQDYYPANTFTEINAAATAYYAQVPTPITFMVGAVLATAFAGIRYNPIHADLATLQAVTAGGFTTTIEGDSAKAITGVDLSGATSFDDVANIINAAYVTGNIPATVEYEPSQGFVITTTGTGANNSVDTIGNSNGGLGEALGLLDGTVGLVDIAGAAAETPQVAASECGKFDGTFNEVVVDRKWRDSANAIAVSDYCQATKRIFGNDTNDADVLGLATAAGTTAGQIHAKNNNKTITTYGSIAAEYPSCSVLGRINTVNYQGTNTTLTLMFKKLPTITTNVLTSTQLKALKSVGANSMIQVGSTSLYSDGRMAGTGWLDTVHGVNWLEKQAQLNVFNLLYTSDTSIPYKDSGVAIAVQQVDLALQQAVRNGLVAAGNDSSGNYLPAGYEIYSVPVQETSAADKSNRIYNGITFKAVGAGALHGLTINGSFTE